MGSTFRSKSNECRNELKGIMNKWGQVIIGVKQAMYLQFRLCSCSFQNQSHLISLLWQTLIIFIQNNSFLCITNFMISANATLYRMWTRWSTKNQDECTRSIEMTDLSVARILTLLIFWVLKWSTDNTTVLRHNMESWCL